MSLRATEGNAGPSLTLGINFAISRTRNLTRDCFVAEAPRNDNLFILKPRLKALKNNALGRGFPAVPPSFPAPVLKPRQDAHLQA